MKHVFSVAAFVCMLATVGSTTVYAMPDRQLPSAAKGGALISLPSNAKEVAPNVYSLGSAKDPKTGEIVDGFMIVHRKDAGKKPSGTPGGGGGGGSACYTYITGGKWKTVEPWVVDPTNNKGLSETTVYDLLNGAVAKWEDAADGTVDGVSTVPDIIGNSSLSTGFAPAGTYDGINGVRFGLLDAGTIGVTSVWYLRGRNPDLVEWDQVYNTHYAWDTNGSSTAMDFDSIATHEIGHAFGMGDLYDSNCTQETMYGYGDYGETYARSLNTGDIAGISKLY